MASLKQDAVQEIKDRLDLVGSDLGALAAAESGPRPEGSVPIPPGEDPILICLAGEAVVALLWLPEGRRSLHLHPGDRARRFPGGAAPAGREDRGRAGGVARGGPAARAEEDDRATQPARRPVLPSHPAGEPGRTEGADPARVPRDHPRGDEGVPARFRAGRPAQGQPGALPAQAQRDRYRDGARRGWR